MNDTIEFKPNGFTHTIQFGGLAMCGNGRPGIHIAPWTTIGNWSGHCGGVMTKEQAISLRDLLNRLIPLCKTGDDLPFEWPVTQIEAETI